METNAIVELAQQENFLFMANFGGQIADWAIDEPEPLGSGKGPSPDQLLAAAVGNCLASSLFFALRKFKQDATPIRVHAEAIPGRNDEGRLRILEINVEIVLSKPASAYMHLDRAISQFEDFCTVTQSVRQSLPVHVTVKDSEGAVLK